MSLCARGRRKKAVHTPRALSGDCQFFFAVDLSNAGVHVGGFAGFPQALGYAKVASFPLKRDQVFRCSALGVSLVVESGWPFFRCHTEGDFLRQAKTELPGDTVQLCHTGVTTGSGVLYVIENKNL